MVKSEICYIYDFDHVTYALMQFVKISKSVTLKHFWKNVDMKLKKKKNKMENLTNDDLNPSSFDSESDNQSDNKSND